MPDEKNAPDSSDGAARQRLDAAINALGESPAGVAAEMGVSRQYIHGLLTTRSFGREFAHTFQSCFGISAAWLLSGKGDMWFGRQATGLGELPILDRLATAPPPKVRSWAGETIRVSEHLCQSQVTNGFRYVLRVTDSTLAPTVMLGDRLLLEGRLGIDLDNGIDRQVVKGRLCGVIYENREMLAEVRFHPHDKRPWPILVTPKRTVRVSRRHDRNLRVLAICCGLVWRPPETLAMPKSAEVHDDGSKS